MVSTYTCSPRPTSRAVGRLLKTNGLGRNWAYPIELPPDAGLVSVEGDPVEYRDKERRFRRPTLRTAVVIGAGERALSNVLDSQADARAFVPAAVMRETWHPEGDAPQVSAHVTLLPGFGGYHFEANGKPAADFVGAAFWPGDNNRGIEVGVGYLDLRTGFYHPLEGAAEVYRGPVGEFTQPLVLPAALGQVTHHGNGKQH